MKTWVVIVGLCLSLCVRDLGAQEPADDPHVVDLIQLLPSPDPAVQEKAGRELLALGRPGLRALLDAAGSRNQFLAAQARSLLTAAGPDAIDSLIWVGNADAYDKPHRRREASAAVARMGESVLPRILTMFTTADPIVSYEFGFATAVLLSMDRLAVEHLIPLVRHPTPQVRQAAATLLAHIADPRFYDALMEGLRSDDPSVRYPSARGLGNIGDRRAAEALLGTLGDRGPSTRSEAAVALGKIYEPRFLGPLSRLARGDQKILVRDTAASVLMEDSHDPVAVRIGKRYKPLTLSPARQGMIQLGFALGFALIGAVLFGLVVEAQNGAIVAAAHSHS